MNLLAFCIYNAWLAAFQRPCMGAYRYVQQHYGHSQRYGSCGAFKACGRRLQKEKPQLKITALLPRRAFGFLPIFAIPS